MDSESNNFVLKETVKKKKKEKRKKGKKNTLLVGYYLGLLINLDICRVNSFAAKSLWGVKGNENATAVCVR